MSIPYFDAHCDTVSHDVPLEKNSLHLDFQRIGAYAPSAQVFAVFVRPRTGKPPVGFDSGDAPAQELEKLGFEYIEKLRGEILKNSAQARLCLSAGDIRAAAAEEKTAALIAVEGAELIGCSPEGLRRAYEQGVRLVNITWNFPNRLSGTAMSGNKSGLSPEGREFVRCAQKMGVAVDMSHISPAAFWDCVEIAQRPIIAGHSNAMALCPHPRNLTDEQFDALKSLGGGAGVNFCADFVGLGRDIGAVAEHIEHFLGLGGEKAVFLGSDFDGVDQLPAGIGGVEDMDKLYEELLRRNYPETLVRDIFYFNLLDIMERCI